MADALTEVLVRRERILRRIAQQRDSIAVAVAGLERPIALIDRIVEVGRVLRAHPAVMAVLLGGVLVLRTRSVIGLISRGIGWWRVFRRVRALVGHFTH